MSSIHFACSIPPPKVPKLSVMSGLIADAISIAIVSYAISVSMVKLFGQKHGYDTDANQVRLLETINFKVVKMLFQYF